MRFSVLVRVTILLAVVIATTSLSPRRATADSFEFKDGDRVVLLGSTLIERAQRYGYIEAELTAALAAQNKTVTFRNLGWSGDTVWAESRGIFDPPAAGYKRMIEQIVGLKPTVILFYYGANEAYEGERGLEPFVKQYNQLLDDLKPTGARVIMVSPLDQLYFSERHPSPDIYNDKLPPYRDAIQKLAEQRGAFFVDLTGPLGTKTPLGSPEEPTAIPSTAMTDTGVHLNAFGYKTLAQVLRAALLGEAEQTVFSVNANGNSDDSSVLKQVAAEGDKLSLTVAIPRVQMPAEVVPQYVIRVNGLKTGRYSLKQNDETLVTLSSEQWAEGAPLYLTDVEQYAALQEVIGVKNELYFHRWRPQNITYLFLFRKHEQGNNASEIPEFDPLILEQEKQIHKLSQPVPHQLTLVPAE